MRQEERRLDETRQEERRGEETRREKRRGVARKQVEMTEKKRPDKTR